MQQLKTNIPRRSSHCAIQKEPFEPGSDYISYLYEVLRIDFCPTCWEKHEESKKKEGGHFWRGKIPLKKEKPSSSDEKMLTFFRETFAEQKNPKVLYVLALYLQRKKQLMLLPSMQQQESLLFELMETGETFSVVPFSLKDEEMIGIFQNISNG